MERRNERGAAWIRIEADHEAQVFGQDCLHPKEGAWIMRAQALGVLD